MAKKDFSQIDAARVQATIADATADEQEAQEVQEAPQRRPRKTYTDEEKAEYLNTMQTSGRKGVKLKRINFAFRPDIYNYVTIMSRVKGQSLAMFVNDCLQQHMEAHEDIYQQVQDFIKRL